MKDSRYEEALERAKQGLPIDEVFPELKESEDERIRKFLVKHVSEWIGCIEHDLKLSSKDVESEEELAMFKAGLAYLEKQKEQQPAECIPDSVKFEEGFKTGRELGFREGVESVKPAEWSEEDEKIVADFLYGINVGFTQKAAKDRAKDILSLLHPQPHWKPSEEQVSILGKVFAGCNLNDSEKDSMVDLFYNLKQMV